MPSPPEQDPLLYAYLRALRLEKGLSQRTVDSYRRDLTQFCFWLQGHEHTLTTASADEARGFLATGDWRPSTRARKTAALRSFYQHAILTEVLSADPTRTLAAPRLESELPRTLSVDEVERLLAGPKSDPAGLRDRALLETMYGAGLRASETLALRLQDIDLDVGFVRTIGKGDKERVVPIGRKAIEALDVYYQRGRPFLGGAGR